MMEVVVLLAAFAFAASVAARRPDRALALAAAGIVTTSSLLWQLGLPNLALPLFFGLGLVTGGAAWLWQQRSCPDRVAVAARSRWLGVPVFAAAGSAAVALATSTAMPADLLAGELGATVAQLGRFNPESGIAGIIASFSTFVLGPLTLALATSVYGSPETRRQLVDAVGFGLILVLVSPVLQWLLLDPIVRPDQRSASGLATVGFFQDSHSLSGYLIICFGAALGEAIASHREGNAGRAALAAALGIGALALNLTTLSRSGLAGMAGAMALVLLMTARFAASDRIRVATGGATVAIVMLAAVTLLVPSVRVEAFRMLGRLDPSEGLESRRPQTELSTLIESRALLWERAAHAATQNPMWGVGPGNLRAAPGRPDRPLPAGLEHENAHNYYLQIAAEYGFPTAVTYAAMWLFVVVALAAPRGSPTAASNAELIRANGIAAGIAGVLAMSLVAHPFLLPEVHMTAGIVAGLGLATVAAVGAPARTLVAGGSQRAERASDG